MTLRSIMMKPKSKMTHVREEPVKLGGQSFHLFCTQRKALGMFNNSNGPRERIWSENVLTKRNIDARNEWFGWGRRWLSVSEERISFKGSRDNPGFW